MQLVLKASLVVTLRVVLCPVQLVLSLRVAHRHAHLVFPEATQTQAGLCSAPNAQLGMSVQMRMSNLSLVPEDSLVQAVLLVASAVLLVTLVYHSLSHVAHVLSGMSVLIPLLTPCCVQRALFRWVTLCK